MDVTSEEHEQFEEWDRRGLREVSDASLRRMLRARRRRVDAAFDKYKHESALLDNARVELTRRVDKVKGAHNDELRRQLEEG